VFIQQNAPYLQTMPKNIELPPRVAQAFVRAATFEVYSRLVGTLPGVKNPTP
jgi:hypothetical protein